MKSAGLQQQNAGPSTSCHFRDAPLGMTGKVYRCATAVITGYGPLLNACKT